MTSGRWVARTRTAAHQETEWRRCTGPRTRGGKSRSKKNALKHELNVRVWSYPELQDRADAIVAACSPSGRILGCSSSLGPWPRHRLMWNAFKQYGRVSWRTLQTNR